MQYSLRNSYVSQGALPSVSVGANDIILEFLILNYVQDVAFCKKLSTNDPSYLTFGDAGFANYWEFLNVYNAGNVDFTFRAVGSGVFSEAMRIQGMYGNNIHVWGIVRAATVTIFINGHQVRSVAKAAHNINSTAIRFFGDQITGGISTPGRGALVRIYSGDLSGITDAQALTIHKRGLRTPYVTPLALSAFEIFRWRGRAGDGTQELASSTNLHDEINNTALALQGGITWGAGRDASWTPR